MIRSPKLALKSIRKLGYLNEISSMSDTYFVAHRVPGGESMDVPAIDTKTALNLIHDGLVKEAGSMWTLSGHTRVVWYTAAEQPAGGGLNGPPEQPDPEGDRQ